MSTDRYSRQSFLGPDSEARISRCTIGLAGLGGGGSHIVQHLAHIGFQRYVIYDDDLVEDSNLIGWSARSQSTRSPGRRSSTWQR